MMKNNLIVSRQLLAAMSILAGNDPYRPILNCLKLEVRADRTMRVSATDSYIAGVYEEAFGRYATRVESTWETAATINLPVAPLRVMLTARMSTDIAGATDITISEEGGVWTVGRGPLCLVVNPEQGQFPKLLCFRPKEGPQPYTVASFGLGAPFKDILKFAKAMGMTSFPTVRLTTYGGPLKPLSFRFPDSDIRDQFIGFIMPMRTDDGLPDMPEWATDGDE